MTLRERRVYFTRLVTLVLDFINRIPHIEAAVDEWAVHTPRAVLLDNGDRVVARDAVHGHGGKKYSFHNEGLAVDLLLYRNGDYVWDGGDAIWTEIDTYCRSLDPEFGLGLRFGDSNHLSFGEMRVDPR